MVEQHSLEGVVLFGHNLDLLTLPERNLQGTTMEDVELKLQQQLTTLRFWYVVACLLLRKDKDMNKHTPLLLAERSLQGRI